MSLRLSLTLVAVILASCAAISPAQEFPSKIRGYKVHLIDVHLRTGDPSGKGSGPSLTIGTPKVVSMALTGITIEAAAEIGGLDQEGEVDFMTFKDISANGIPIEVDEYRHPFKLRKGQKIVLPVPVRSSVSSLNLAKAAYQASAAQKDFWQVTGTVFVFGRFKRMGLTFKRVVPVTVTLTIADPVKAIVAGEPR